ncbi:MAG: GNAT family N-acetyltransferase [Chloroflexota bacterium]|nr:GNAT family N-acetyltransferase [Chloroflexota bacterium]
MDAAGATLPINVRGQQVALGPFLPAQIAAYAEWLQDPEIAILAQGTFTARSAEAVAEAIRRPDPASVVFAVYALPDHILIGETLLRDIDHRHGTAEFGITIGRKDYWERGYGSEATRLVLDYGFRFLNLYNILLLTTSYNPRAQRAYTKAGFREIGRRQGSLLIQGRRYDDIYMECLATDFIPPDPGWYVLPD